MVKILACSDIHGSQFSVDHIIKKAKNNNVKDIVIAGDLFNFNEFKENFIGKFKKNNLDVFFVQGNHENTSICNFIEDVYDLKNLEKAHHHIDNENVLFGLSGCVDYGDLILEEFEVFNLLKEKHENIKNYNKKNILITHMHPDSILTGNFSKIVKPSKGLFDFIQNYNPDLLICGHIHEAKNLVEKIGKTIVLHASSEGKIVDLDNLLELENEMIN